MPADLHIHTNASDGSWTPEELIAQVKTTNLTKIAITDHDTIDGVLPGIEAAKSLELELQVIPGIEINTEYNDRDVHILGYWIDINNKLLDTTLTQHKIKRMERVEAIIERLNKLNFEIDFQQVLQLTGNGVIGRAHIARVLMDKGYVSSISEAFDKFLGRNKPAYVSYQRITPCQAIDLIKQAGGVPVLAHPGLVGNDDIIYDLVEFGLVGLEAVYPSHSKEQVDNYLKLCRKLQLCPTGGSDCHGLLDKDRAPLGSISIPEQWVYQLQERAQNT